MIAKFYSLEWKNSDSEFVTRMPKEKKPSGFCKEIKRNEDGSVVYLVPKKNQYILTLQTEDGKLVSEDIYGVIKYNKSNVRITKKFRESFESFMQTREYSIEDRTGFIYGIYDGVRDFFQSNP